MSTTMALVCPCGSEITVTTDQGDGAEPARHAVAQWAERHADCVTTWRENTAEALAAARRGEKQALGMAEHQRERADEATRMAAELIREIDRNKRRL